MRYVNEDGKQNSRKKDLKNLVSESLNKGNMSPDRNQTCSPRLKKII